MNVSITFLNPLVGTLTKIIGMSFCKITKISFDDWNKFSIPDHSSKTQNNIVPFTTVKNEKKDSKNQKRNNEH